MGTIGPQRGRTRNPTHLVKYIEQAYSMIDGKDDNDDRSVMIAEGS